MPADLLLAHAVEVTWPRLRALLTFLPAVLLTTAAFVVFAQQQTYPAKPIRLIVPYPPGAGADGTARALADSITAALGQPVVIDNRPGAGATVGTAIASKATPDGYTLLCATSGGMVYAPALGMNVGYDPLKDFAPVGLAGHVPYALFSHGGLAPNNMREFIAYAKSMPGKLNMGSPGTGTPNHIGGVLLNKLAGIELVHVPYRGGSAMLTDLIAGQVHVIFVSLPTAQPHVASGRVKALAVGHTRRISAAPHLPTVAETVPGFSNTGWRGLVAPPATPRGIVQTLNTAVNKGLNTPAMKQQIIGIGLEPATSTPEGLHELMSSELQLWRKILKEANITVGTQ